MNNLLLRVYVTLVALPFLYGCSGNDVAKDAAHAFVELFGKEIREGVTGNSPRTTTPIPNSSVAGQPAIRDVPTAWCVDEESGWIRAGLLEEVCATPETKFLRRVDAEARAQAIGGKYDTVRICLRSGSKTSMGLYAVELGRNQQCDPSGLEFTTTGAAFKGLDKLQKQ